MLELALHRSHLFSNAGGGGERVLWTAVAAMQRSNPNLVCAIYSGDTDATKEEIIAKVKVSLTGHLCATFLPNADRALVSLRHYSRLQGTRLRLPEVQIPRRGHHLASLYIAWAKFRLNAPRAGGNGVLKARPLHW